MKAIILNSGMGSRLKELTKNVPKSMVEIGNDETIFSKAVNTLSKYDIDEFIITTGYLSEVLKEYASTSFPDVNFTFVHNPEYDKTNYINSLDYVSDDLVGDILLLHGDLIFDEEVVSQILLCDESCMVTDSQLEIPKKDFKAKIVDGYVKKISVDYFGDDAVSCQPLYKLKNNDWINWKNKIRIFCGTGKNDVYAEEALNVLLNEEIKIKAIDIRGYFCSEIDTKEDLNNYRKRIEAND
ncbi:MAG: hypothetical protein BZ138_00675 [Methanosphaera sp. rholeuAM270]|nr:MAG: hypothetical protein BZ138_00675 [Methanosphaera sp. rholeuAM270]